MIDSHAHIFLEEFEEDLADVIERAEHAGITKILMPNIDCSTIERVLGVAAKFPQMCIPMMGLHPCYVKSDYKRHLKVIEDWLSKESFLAVGEIGTDLYWDDSYWRQQKDAFSIQCELALQHHLPVVIHCRESIDATVEIVAPFASQGLQGVFHCFTGTRDQALEITDLGFYLGLGGVSTFKNGGLDTVIPYLDPHKILLETDAPYLAPTPHRGKRNEPAYVQIIAEKIASLLQLSKEALVNYTVKNTEDLFKISSWQA